MMGVVAYLNKNTILAHCKKGIQPVLTVIIQGCPHNLGPGRVGKSFALVNSAAPMNPRQLISLMFTT